MKTIIGGTAVGVALAVALSYGGIRSPLVLCLVVVSSLIISWRVDSGNKEKKAAAILYKHVPATGSIRYQELVSAAMSELQAAGVRNPYMSAHRLDKMKGKLLHIEDRAGGAQISRQK